MEGIRKGEFGYLCVAIAIAIAVAMVDICQLAICRQKGVGRIEHPCLIT